MQYRKNVRNGDELSALGFGCMRFPKLASGKIDMVETKKLVDAAIDAGINYFDVAYIYKGCEDALGIALEGRREKVKIATKLPLALVRKYEDLDRLFGIQLASLRTDYVDYYLMHMLNSLKQWEFLKSLGIERWIEEKKKSGKIRNIGFSFHGSRDEFVKLVNDYDFEFVLVQYNYLDEHVQASRSGIELCAEKKIPVFVMEPLRGGYLANKLPKKAKKIVEGSGKTAVELSLNWIWNHSEIVTVLSGMNELVHISDNVKYAEKALPGNLSKEDSEAIEKIKTEINKKMVVPCTGCGYCMPCPFGVQIPACFASRNDFQNGKKMGWQKYFVSCGILTENQGGASKCRNCGACEKHCPQNIPIRASLKEVKHKMEPFWFKGGIFFVKKFLNPKKKTGADSKSAVSDSSKDK